MNDLRISEINITPIKPNKGLVGFASCVINDAFSIGDIAIHQKLDGSINLAYPAKNLNGHKIHIFKPINKIAGEALRTAISEDYLKLMDKALQKHSGNFR